MHTFLLKFINYILFKLFDKGIIKFEIYLICQYNISNYQQNFFLFYILIVKLIPL